MPEEVFAPLESTNFLTLILTPEIANLLIMEDQQVSYVQADKIRIESSDFGQEHQPDVEEDHVKRHLLDVEIPEFLAAANIEMTHRVSDSEGANHSLVFRMFSLTGSQKTIRNGKRARGTTAAGFSHWGQTNAATAQDSQ